MFLNFQICKKKQNFDSLALHLRDKLGLRFFIYTRNISYIVA